MNYRDLIGEKRIEGSIKQLVNYDEIPAVAILDQAQQWIMRRLRVRQMVKSPAATGNMSTSVDYVALPSLFLKTIRFQISGADKLILEAKTLEQMEELIQYDSDDARVSDKPTFYTEDATNIRFDTMPDSAYAYRWLYYQELTQLSEANPTNFLTTNGLTALNAVCTGFAFGHLRNYKERDFYLKLGQAEIATLNAENQDNISADFIRMVE